METVDLVFVFPTQVDKHGNAMRCGKTADYIDASGTIVLGKVVSTYTALMRSLSPFYLYYLVNTIR